MVKRALVKILLGLAAAHTVALNVNRDSSSPSRAERGGALHWEEPSKSGAECRERRSKNTALLIR